MACAGDFGANSAEHGKIFRNEFPMALRQIHLALYQQRCENSRFHC